MKPALFEKTNQQLKSLVEGHFREIQSYLHFPEAPVTRIPEVITTSLERLAALCDSSAQTATTTQYQEVRRCLTTLDYFLQIMNQPQDVTFKQTALGVLLEKGRAWADAVYSSKCCSLQQVWAILDPVKPDTLNYVGNGVYEALWWKPVPVMDVEIMYRTDGIVLQGHPFEPHNMSGGVAVRFTIT